MLTKPERTLSLNSCWTMLAVVVSLVIAPMAADSPANAANFSFTQIDVPGIAEAIGCHTFRATGITAYLSNGGALEHAQEMAAHESPRTTKLYDRTKERLTQDEVERIRF